MYRHERRNRWAVLAALALSVTAAWAGGSDVAQPATAASSASFILQLGVLVFAAKVGGALFERGHLPVVLGELTAGVLVGPYLLGGVALPFFPNGLMGDVGSLLVAGGSFYGLVTVTLAVLFFLIGLDTDLRQVRRYSAGGVAAGSCGFLLAFGVTLLVLVRVSGVLAGTALTWTSPQALLISTAVSVTSVGVLARMLSARQRLESPAGTVALTAAMTDNVLGLLFFTVFAGVSVAVTQGAESSGLLIARVAVRTLLGLGVVALFGIPIARHMNALAMREKNYARAFVVSAACLLIAGGVMGTCGLPVMSGAYVMGIAFSSMDFRHEIRERLDFVSMVLVPACFATLGMRVNPNLLANEAVLGAAAVFAGAAAVSKLAGCSVSAAAAGLNVSGCLRVGVVTLPRGELSLALLAAVMGLTALPEGLFFGVILLVTVSCVGMPFLTDRMFAWGGNGMRGRHVMPDPVRIVFQFLSHQAALMMVSRVVEIFEDEGFYAQLLNRHETLYRISRETQVIHLRSREGEVVFECSERERPLVNTVMLELSSGVEQSLRELRKPLDDVLLRKNMQHAEPGETGLSGVLRNRIVPETCLPRLLATTKQGVLSELISLLYDNGFVTDRERALQAVFEREQSLSTGLEYGVALPHARTDAVSRLVCAVGLKKEGLDFGAVDGRPARIVVLVLAPEHASAPQLQVIAQVCRVLDEKGRAALLACETPEDMCGALVGGTSVAVVRRGKLPVLGNCLGWQSIALDMATDDREQVLALLLALCARSGAVGSLEEVRKDVRAAAAQPPERIGEAVAVFPVQTQNVDRMVVALGVLAKGLAPVKGVCRVWVMVLYPSSSAAAYAELRGALAQALGGKRLDALLAAKNSQEALAVLTAT